MARVKSISEGRQNVKIHPTEVDLFYQVVQDRAGRRFMHLSTFGSDSRTSAPKSSQSIQLDEARALELVRLVAQAFGINSLN